MVGEEGATVLKWVNMLVLKSAEGCFVLMFPRV